MIQSIHRIYVITSCCLILATFHTTTPLFTTLDELIAFTDTLEPNPKPNNLNLLNPDFSNHIESTCPSYLQTLATSLLKTLHLNRASLWNVDTCISLMKQITQERIQLGYGKDQIIKLPSNPKDTYIIWGDIMGALHSLTRSLTHLRTEGIIDNNFTVIKADTYLIFNGNLVNRSPYSLETLAVVLRLLQQNPRNVVYVQGKHEQKEIWPNHALATELRTQCNHRNSEEIPFFENVIQFFDTLPLAAYIQTHYSDFTPTLIRISNLGFDETLNIKEADHASFLLQGVDEITPHALTDTSPTPSFVDIRAIIESREYLDGTYYYLETKGLSLTSPDRGSCCWVQLSCPTYVYQKMFNFHYDTFTQLKMGKAIEETALELNRQDMLTQNGFSKTSYDIITGTKITDTYKPKADIRTNSQKITPDKRNEFVIGMITDFSNNTGTTGELLCEGTWTKIRQINHDKQGINGKNIRLIMLDNASETHIAHDKIKELLENYKTNLLLTPYDMETINAALPFIKSKQLLTLFCRNGSQTIRESSLKYVINYRTSYYNEAFAIVDYAAQTLFLRKFALCYHNDSNRNSALDGARDALKKHGISEWIEVPYSTDVTNLDQAVKKLSKTTPHAVVLLGSGNPSTALLLKVGIPYLFNKHVLCISSLSNSFGIFSQQKGISSIFTRLVPNPADKSLQITREYLDHMKEYAPEEVPTIDGFEGYLNMCLLIDVAEKMSGEITAEKIITAFESMNNYHFKDLVLTFDPASRELVAHKQLWIDTGNGPWISVVR